MVEKYITQLLYKHPRVTIPEVGSFEAYEAPAEWTPGEQSISPTTRKIRFNDEIKEDNSKLLAQAVAEGEGISTGEASQKVGIYSLDIEEALKEENEYVFSDIGTIFINIEHKLELLPNPDLNMDSDSFGLPVVSSDADTLSDTEPDSSHIWADTTEDSQTVEEPETATTDENFFDSVDTDNSVQESFPYTEEPKPEEVEEQDDQKDESENHAFIIATPDEENVSEATEEPAIEAKPELTVEQVPVVEAASLEQADEAVATAKVASKTSPAQKKKLKKSKETMVVVEKKKGMPVWGWLLLIPIALLVLFGILITVLPEDTRMAYFPFLGKEPAEHVTEREGVVVTGTNTDGTVIDGDGEAINIENAGTDDAATAVTATTNNGPSTVTNQETSSSSTSSSSNYSGSTGFASSGKYIVPNSPKKYYVVVGSFSDATNARQLEGELKSKGLKARVTMSSGSQNTYRVVVGEHNSLSEAQSTIGKIQSEFNNNLWVLKY